MTKKRLYEDIEYGFELVLINEELMIIDYDFSKIIELGKLKELTQKSFIDLFIVNIIENAILTDEEIEKLLDDLKKSEFYKSLKKDKNTNIELSIYVKNAINNFTQWSGSFTFEKAYLEEDKIYLHFKEDEEETNFELYEYFKYMREKLISCLGNNYCDSDNYCNSWEKRNVKRWNDYTYYILPILQVLDDIENGKKVYVEYKE